MTKRKNYTSKDVSKENLCWQRKPMPTKKNYCQKTTSEQKLCQQKIYASQEKLRKQRETMSAMKKRAKAMSTKKKNMPAKKHWQRSVCPYPQIRHVLRAVSTLPAMQQLLCLDALLVDAPHVLVQVRVAAGLIGTHGALVLPDVEVDRLDVGLEVVALDFLVALGALLKAAENIQMLYYTRREGRLRPAQRYIWWHFKKPLEKIQDSSFQTDRLVSYHSWPLLESLWGFMIRKWII